MQPITLDLPLPPSLNKIWRPAIIRGKPALVKRTEYEKWIEAATLLVRSQARGKGWMKITGPFMVISRMSPNGRGQKDLDNYTMKAILDLCQRTGVIENDKSNKAGGCLWGEAPLGIRVTLVPVTEL
jgi:Holliday junction resolvase RusA-like endonuclease